MQTNRSHSIIFNRGMGAKMVNLSVYANYISLQHARKTCDYDFGTYYNIFCVASFINIVVQLFVFQH